ncbi:MAG TPA: winged helix-turn-helix domain-containing protein, partial [Microbacteriaceae bacterium]|nr:winged helix-turn-helix domain-containing protein [Microbacteriaceae bacterium]
MHQTLFNTSVAPTQNESAGPQVGSIAERISTAIASGILNVGEKLPPETELAAQFGVAVATLRKALASLRSDGVVETRRGRNGGTFIVKSPFPSADLLYSTIDALAIVTLRDFADEHAAISGMAARL